MQQGFSYPPLSKTVKIIIIAIVSMLLLNGILQKTSGVSLVGIMGLSLTGIKSGLVFQLFTYPFIETGLFGALFSCLILWFLGGELENLWGRKRFLGYFATVVFGGGLLFLLFDSLFISGGQAIFVGMGGLSSALCLTYAFLFPQRMMLLIIFPVKAWIFAGILIFMSLYQAFLSPGGAAHGVGQLGCMGLAYLWMVAVSHRKWKELWDKTVQMKPKKSSGHLKLVKDDEDDDQKPTLH